MSIHDGHRQRLKQRFLEEGLESFTDIQVLELLLFFSVPRQDTNPIAHALLDCCFSFQGKFFHFRPIHRNGEIEDNLPDPVAVRLLFREQFDPLNERPHELLPLHLGGGFIDLIERQQ